MSAGASHSQLPPSSSESGVMVVLKPDTLCENVGLVFSVGGNTTVFAISVGELVKQIPFRIEDGEIVTELQAYDMVVRVSQAFRAKYPGTITYLHDCRVSPEHLLEQFAKLIQGSNNMDLFKLSADIPKNKAVRIFARGLAEQIEVHQGGKTLRYSSMIEDNSDQQRTGNLSRLFNYLSTCDDMRKAVYDEAGAYIKGKTKTAFPRDKKAMETALSRLDKTIDHMDPYAVAIVSSLFSIENRASFLNTLQVFIRVIKDTKVFQDKTPFDSNVFCLPSPNVLLDLLEGIGWLDEFRQKMSPVEGAGPPESLLFDDLKLDFYDLFVDFVREKMSQQPSLQVNISARIHLYSAIAEMRFLCACWYRIADVEALLAIADNIKSKICNLTLLYAPRGLIPGERLPKKGSDDIPRTMYHAAQIFKLNPPRGSISWWPFGLADASQIEAIKSSIYLPLPSSVAIGAESLCHAGFQMGTELGCGPTQQENPSLPRDLNHQGHLARIVLAQLNILKALLPPEHRVAQSMLEAVTKMVEQILGQPLLPDPPSGETTGLRGEIKLSRALMTCIVNSGAQGGDNGQPSSTVVKRH